MNESLLNYSMNKLICSNMAIVDLFSISFIEFHTETDTQHFIKMFSFEYFSVFFPSDKENWTKKKYVFKHTTDADIK